MGGGTQRHRNGKMHGMYHGSVDQMEGPIGVRNDVRTSSST